MNKLLYLALVCLLCQIPKNVEANVNFENQKMAIVISKASYDSTEGIRNVAADRIKKYYAAYPKMIDKLSRCIGYRVRPSWIWNFEKDGHNGLVLGMVNDGIAAVPGVLRIAVFSEDGRVKESGCLDPGYPKPQGVRQAMILLPKGIDWKGLRIKAELEVKGKSYPVEWSCDETIHADGSFTLNPGI